MAASPKKVTGIYFIFTVLIALGLVFAGNKKTNAQETALIRIGLAEGVQNAVISTNNVNTGGIKVTDLYSQASFELDNNQTAAFVLNSSLIDFNGICQQPGPFTITLQQENSNSYLSYGGKLYRGKLEISLGKNGGLIVVNELPMDDYLYGVLPKEMLAWFPKEALKAQAVASRTYTYTNLNKHANSNYNLCPTTHCQVYGGVGEEDPRTNDAVNSTRGEVLTYNGALISAFYHASSGGHTENAENVWSNPLPYIKGVVDYDQAFPRYNWTRTLTPEQVEEGLRKSNQDVGTVKKVEPWGGFGVSGRPIFIRVTGSKGSLEIKSSNFRTIFDLPSTLFTIEQSLSGYNVENTRLDRMNYVTALNGNGQIKTVGLNGSYMISGSNTINKITSDPLAVNYQQSAAQIKFVGQGWGHGLGMSQWGAYGLAEQGYNYDQILKHYYQGINIEIR